MSLFDALALVSQLPRWALSVVRELVHSCPLVKCFRTIRSVLSFRLGFYDSLGPSLICSVLPARDSVLWGDNFLLKLQGCSL